MTGDTTRATRNGQDALDVCREARSPTTPSALCGSGSWRFGGGGECWVEVESGGVERVAADDLTELVGVLDRTMLGAEPDDRLGLALPDSWNLAQLRGVRKVDSNFGHGEILRENYAFSLGSNRSALSRSMAIRSPAVKP